MSWYTITEVDIRKYIEIIEPIYECLNREITSNVTDPFLHAIIPENPSKYKIIAQQMGDFHEKIAGAIPGYTRLKVGNCLGLDILKNDMTEVYELKNSFNTMNSSSAESVINKLKRAHSVGIKSRLVLINCKNGNVPRFKSPDYIDVWDGKKFYSHITGSDSFYDRLLETFSYTFRNFNNPEETLQSVYPLQSPD